MTGTDRHCTRSEGEELAGMEVLSDDYVRVCLTIKFDIYGTSNLVVNIP